MLMRYCGLKCQLFGTKMLEWSHCPLTLALVNNNECFIWFLGQHNSKYSEIFILNQLENYSYGSNFGTLSQVRSHPVSLQQSISRGTLTILIFRGGKDFKGRHRHESRLRTKLMKIFATDALLIFDYTRPPALSTTFAISLFFDKNPFLALSVQTSKYPIVRNTLDENLRTNADQVCLMATARLVLVR